MLSSGLVSLLSLDWIKTSVLSEGVEGGRKVAEVSGDVCTRHQCLIFGRTNLLRNVCSAHSYTVALSIIGADTFSHGWTDGLITKISGKKISA